MRKTELIIIGLIKAFFGVLGVDWFVQGWASEGRKALLTTILQVVIPTVVGIVVFLIIIDLKIEAYIYGLYLILTVIIIDALAFIIRIFYYFCIGLSLVFKQR